MGNQAIAHILPASVHSPRNTGAKNRPIVHSVISAPIPMAARYPILGSPRQMAKA